jgi:transposase-like protein
MIQMLIPLGLEAIQNILQEEVSKLVGKRYERGTLSRWGSNPGSAYLGEQKVTIRVPRVRDKAKGTEVPLQHYQELQNPAVIDEKILGAVLHGISTRDYKKAATMVPETFGIKKSSVSRRFIEATEGKLKEFSERDLSGNDIVAIFMDGKTFAETSMIIALGITIEGDKKILGFIESGTENALVIKEFLQGLQDRNLNIDKEILFIIDGSKGLYKGIKAMMGTKAVIQRCQWHKRENVVSYLPKSEQSRFRKKLQNAYQKPTYAKAKQELEKIGKELKILNASACTSLYEGLEETLTLHRLGLFPELGVSFKTTNCIENINKQLCKFTSRVCYWKNSQQKQRWVASSLLVIEQRLNKVRGHRMLSKLRAKMMDQDKSGKKVAA